MQTRRQFGGLDAWIGQVLFWRAFVDA